MAAHRTQAGVGRAAGGVRGGRAGRLGAGLGGAGAVIVQLQLTLTSQTDSPVQLALAHVRLVVVPAHGAVHGGAGGAGALHHVPRHAGAGGQGVAVEAGTDTLRVAVTSMHHDDGLALPAALLQHGNVRHVSHVTHVRHVPHVRHVTHVTYLVFLGRDVQQITWLGGCDLLLS